MIARTIRQTPLAWQWLALAVVLLCLFGALPAHATTQEIRVLALGVDDLSTTANEKAFDYAKKRAVFLAIRKLGFVDADKRAMKLSPEALATIIRGATVGQTKRIGTRTYAEVNVTIVDEALRRALDMAPDTSGQPVAAKMRGILALPVYVTPARPFLWERENILRPALSDEVLKQAHGSVLIAGGDFNDLRLIDYQNALKVTADELKPMFEHYGVQEIVIVVLTPGTIGTVEPSSVLLRRLSAKAEQNEVMEIKPSAPEDTLERRIQDAASAIGTALTQISASTAGMDQDRLDKATKIHVQFAYATPRELATLQKTLREAPGVLLLELPAIMLTGNVGTVYLEGDKEDLRKALLKKTVLVTEAGDGWRVSLR